MLHFLTGMYYFTWFENLLIIIAGLSLGHFLHLIVRQVIAIRNHKSLTKIIRTMIPWLVLLLVLMLSPVFASGIAVGWMVIIGLLECVIEQVVITKFGQQLHHQRTEHRPARQQHTDRPARPVHHSAAKQSHTPEHEQAIESNSAAEQAQSAESAAKPAVPAAQQPVKSAESASTAEHQSPVATNQAASTTTVTESQSETSAHESRQPTSQEIMDHMFDFDPNVDYEAEAKAAAAEADKQSQEEDTHDKN